MLAFDTADLIRTARAAGGRLTTNRALRAGARATAGVLALALLLSLASVVIPVPVVRVRDTLVAAVVVGLLVVAVSGLVRRVDMLTASRLLDISLHLDERVSTAVELALVPAAPSPMGARVIADASARIGGVSLGGVFPRRMPGETWAVPILILLLVAWQGWFHGVVIPGTPAHRTQQAIVREGQRLERFAQSLQSRARAERMPVTRRSASQMRDLGARLQQERIDRAEALARIAELSRQIEAARQQITERLENLERSKSSQSSVPAELMRRQALQRQIRQLQELTSRLQQNPTAASRDALDRLSAIAQEGEGTQPAQVQRQLSKAREELERGNAGAAAESLTAALRELEGLDALLADQEGLRDAQRQLQRSQANVASGGADPEEAVEQPTTAQVPTSPVPGQNPLSSEPGTESPPPPRGPNEGTEAGIGRVQEKMGPPSPRLQAPRTPQRVRGAQGEGEVAASEVLGAGRQGTSQVQSIPVSPSIVAQADRAMERARIPGRYRLIVRRYFERLARLR